ncbi:MAG: ABC transporter permease subunit [Bacilli bacterium]|nr:ABC transporter permease subunit [Bacilli bacterium]
MKQEVKMHKSNLGKVLKAVVKDWRLYVLIAPMVIWYILWAYKPMGGLLMAFQRFEPALGISGSEFRGLGNFQIIVSGIYSSKFWGAFRNTFLISLYGLIFAFPFPIILALFFSETGSSIFRKITQTITYLPHFLSEVTITSIVLMLVYHGERMTGVVSQLLYYLKVIPYGRKIIDTPNYFRPLYIITGIWKEAGYSSIVYFAAIMGISPVLYEAIRVDGGNKLQEIRYVTLPGMAPTLIIMIILRIGRMLSVGYERVLLLYNPNIYSTADVLSTFEQRIGIIEGVYAVGSAAGMFNSIIGFALVISANFISRRVSKTSLW